MKEIQFIDGEYVVGSMSFYTFEEAQKYCDDLTSAVRVVTIEIKEQEDKWGRTYFHSRWFDGNRRRGQAFCMDINEHIKIWKNDGYEVFCGENIN